MPAEPAFFIGRYIDSFFGIRGGFFGRRNLLVNVGF
jgi:hypothetical protein